jgi:iron-sulfur cluster assembly protein
MAYSDKVIDHYENPRNVGSFDKGDDTVGTGMVGAPACGDVMKLQIKVNPDTGVIEAAQEQRDRAGAGAAAREDPLLHPGRRRDQGRRQRLQGQARRGHGSRLKTMAITLTEAAARHVNRYLSRRGKGLGVRLGVKTTGCSGLAYKLEYVDEAAPEDIVFENHGVKVLIDPKSLAYIDGTELDFVREGLNEGFRFNNPNERDRCGCGESFRV